MTKKYTLNKRKPAIGKSSIGAANKEMLARYKNAETDAEKKKIMGEIVVANDSLVRSVINKWFSNYSGDEDALQVGKIGLLEAANRYDPEKETEFSTYATTWIRSEVTKYIRQNTPIHLPTEQYYKVKDIKKAIDMLENEGYDNPSTEQIAEKTGLSESDVEVLISYTRQNQVSMETTISGDGDDDITIADTISDDTDTDDEVEDKYTKKELAHEVEKILDVISDKRIVDIIKRYLGIGEYKESESFASIAETYGVSQSRVRDMYNKGIRTLRKPAVARILKEFWED